LALVGYGVFLMTELGIRALIHSYSGQRDPWWPVSLSSGSRLKGIPVWIFGLFFLAAGLISGVRDISHRVSSQSASSRSEGAPSPPPAGQGFELKVVSSPGTQKVMLLSNFPETLREIRFDAVYSLEESQVHKAGVGFPELPFGTWQEVTGLTTFDQPGSRFKSVEIAGKGIDAKNKPIEIRCSWQKPAAQP
jgi:hypothetical protein